MNTMLNEAWDESHLLEVQKQGQQRKQDPWMLSRTTITPRYIHWFGSLHEEGEDTAARTFRNSSEVKGAHGMKGECMRGGAATSGGGK